MKREHNSRIQELCAQIAIEQDQQTFLNLVEELNRLLGANDRQPATTNDTTQGVANSGGKDR